MNSALAGIREIRDHLLKVDVDLNALPSLQPDAIAAAVMRCDPDPEWRERILRGMTLVAMFDGSPSPEALAQFEVNHIQLVPLQLSRFCWKCPC